MRTDPVTNHHEARNRTSTISSSSISSAASGGPSATQQQQQQSLPRFSLLGPPRVPFESPRQNSRCSATVTRLRNQSTANRNTDPTSASNLLLSANQDSTAASNQSLSPNQKAEAASNQSLSSNRISTAASNQSLSSNQDPLAPSASNNSLKSSASQSTIKSFASSNQGTLKASSYQSATLSSSSSSSSSYENNTIKASGVSSSSLSHHPVSSTLSSSSSRAEPRVSSSDLGCKTIAVSRDVSLSSSPSPLQRQTSHQPQQQHHPQQQQQSVVYASSPNLRFTPSHPLRLALHQGAAAAAAASHRTNNPHQRALPPFGGQPLPIHHPQQHQHAHQHHHPLQQHHPERSPTGTGSLLNIPFPVKTPTHSHPPHYVVGAGPCSPPIVYHHQHHHHLLAASPTGVSDFARGYGTAPAIPKLTGAVKGNFVGARPASIIDAGASPSAKAASLSGDEAPKTKKKFLKLTPFRTSAKKTKKAKKEEAKKDEAKKDDASTLKNEKGKHDDASSKSSAIDCILATTTESSIVSGGGGGFGEAEGSMTTSTISTSDYQDLDAASSTTSSSAAYLRIDGLGRKDEDVDSSERERSASSRIGVVGGGRNVHGGSQRSTAPLICSSSNNNVDAIVGGGICGIDANCGNGVGAGDRGTPTHHGSLHNFLFNQRGGPLAFFNPFSTNLDSPETSMHDTSVDSQVSVESSQTLPTGDASDDADLSSMSAAPAPLDADSPPSSRTEDATTPPSKLALFFGLTRRNLKSQLKRTKSMTRLYRDRKKINAGGTSIDNGDASGNESFGSQGQLGRLRTSRSHESLLTNALKSSGIPSSSLDLTPGLDITIKPLHPSVLGQENCFQVSTPTGTKFFACRTAEEREKWMECIRKTVQPNLEMARRRDNTLTIWILEAKCVTAKKKYFCEVILDRNLFARTTSKQKGDILFWGEHFEFSNLPDVQTVSVNIYRESGAADKKKKKNKSKNVLLGVINIPTSSLNCGQMVERWYPAPALTAADLAILAATPGKGGVSGGARDSSSLPLGSARVGLDISSVVVGKSFASAWSQRSAEVPVLRVKAKWQTVEILPMTMYKELLEYLTTDYALLCEVLEPNISVKAKEEVATSLVRVLHKVGKANDFLVDITMSEIDSLENESLVFRGNTLATKSMEAYMKVVGERYLRDTIGDFVRNIMDSPEDCEVDPQRIANLQSLHKNQANLTMYVEMVWVKIMNSACYFPTELRSLFSRLRQKCLERKNKIEVLENLISSSIFLRFICPAVMSPSLFFLTQAYPQERSARNLTLIAKTVQTLANFNQFGRKEDFMSFMNSFVESEWASMKQFLHQISSPEHQSTHHLEHDPAALDLGREVSILRGIIAENLDKIPCKEALHSIARLKKILAKLDSFSTTTGGGASESLSNVTTPRNASVDGESPLSVTAPLPSADYSEVCDFQPRRNTTTAAPASSSVTASKTFGGGLARCYEERPSITRSAQSLPAAAANCVGGGEAESSLANAGFLTTGRPRKKAARDLRTSDDYVLCSALEESPTSMGINATTAASGADQSPAISQLTSPASSNYANYARVASPAQFNSSPYQQPQMQQQLLQQRVGNAAQVEKGTTAAPVNSHYVPGKHLSMCSNEDYVDLVNFMERLSGDVDMETQQQHRQQQQAVLSPGSAPMNSETGYHSFNSNSDNSNQLYAHAHAHNCPVATAAREEAAAVASGIQLPHPLRSPAEPLSSSSIQPLNFSNPLSSCAGRSNGGSKDSSLYQEPPCRSSNYHYPNQTQQQRPYHPRGNSFSGGTALNGEHEETNLDSPSFRPQQPQQQQQQQQSKRQSHPLSRLSGVSSSSTSSSIGDDAGAAAATVRTKSPRSRSLTTTPTDGTISPMSCPEVTNGGGGAPNASSLRRNYSSHTNPRMGMRQVQQQKLAEQQLQQQQMSQHEYEAEIEALRRQLDDLSSTQMTRMESLSKQWEIKLVSEQQRLQRQQEEKDDQMKNIVARLVTVEEELRREQSEMHDELADKVKIIQNQERQITTLDGANQRLLNVLGHFRNGEEEEEASREEEDSPMTPTSPPPTQMDTDTVRRGKESGC